MFKWRVVFYYGDEIMEQFMLEAKNEVEAEQKGLELLEFNKIFDWVIAYLED